MGNSHSSSKVHIRLQPVRGSKSVTTVQGLGLVRLPKSGEVLPIDLPKMVKALKTMLNRGGKVIDDEEYGKTIQMQGDVRKEIAQFLIKDAALISKEQVV